MALNCCYWLAEEKSDLIGQHLFLVAEDDGDAQGLRQCAQQTLDSGLDGDATRRGIDVVVFHPLFGCGLGPESLAAQRVGGAMHGDPAKAEADMIGANQALAAPMQ